MCEQFSQTSGEAGPRGQLMAVMAMTERVARAMLQGMSDEEVESIVGLVMQKILKRRRAKFPLSTEPPVQPPQPPAETPRGWDAWHDDGWVDWIAGAWNWETQSETAAWREWPADRRMAVSVSDAPTWDSGL